MHRPARAPLELSDQPLASDLRQRYEEIVRRAMRHAERHLPTGQAFELAHEIALEMLRRPPALMSDALLYLRVTSRVISSRRLAERRAIVDRNYLDLYAGGSAPWSRPDADAEASELYERIQATLAEMPPAMRQAFLLVREHELTYKEAAERLGVTVGTVHTQLSRANVLLRECVNRYHADAPPKFPKGKKQ